MPDQYTFVLSHHILNVLHIVTRLDSVLGATHSFVQHVMMLLCREVEGPHPWFGDMQLVYPSATFGKPICLLALLQSAAC